MLKRRKGLKRVAIKRGGRLRSTSKKRMRDLTRRKKVREAVFARDGSCLLSPYGPLNPQGSEWGPCFGEPLTYHHVLKASQGGKYTVENGKTLCAGHNDMVEDYPKPAHAIGLVDLSWEQR